VSAPDAALPLPPELQSSRVVVVSDFNCPYCFTLNEWLNGLGVASQVFWVGVEHKPHLPSRVLDLNRAADLTTLSSEVSDVQRRAPEVGVALPPVWLNSQRALLLQAAVEVDEPQRAASLRTAIFRRFWREGGNIAAAEELDACQAEAGLEPSEERFLDPEQLSRITAWWAQALDRIPCMLAPSGARHLGLQDRAAVEAFVLGALHEPPPGPSCR
jgi:predicted DsbA family dithiol-disulfide isomerase